MKKYVIGLLICLMLSLTSLDARARSSGGAESAVAVLESHYQALANRNFETAYYLRSNNWRSEHSYNWFYNNWENNIYIELVSSSVLSNDGYDAVIKIRLYAEDYAASGKKCAAYYRGKAYMVLENGKWKIDDIQVAEE